MGRMRRRAATLAIAAALSLAPAAHATFRGGNGRIAFDVHGTSLDDQNRGTSYRELHTVKPDSRGDHTVRECQVLGDRSRTGDCSIDYHSPAWAPTGRRLAFDAGRSVALVNSDGSGFRLLAPFTSDDGEPAWSPSGTKLVIAGRSGSGTGLYVADPATGKARRIASAAGGPDWSSRNRIAFERRGNLFSIKPDGRGLRRLTRRGGKDPSWSPSGRSIVFARSRGIYTMRADGGGLRRLLRCRGCATPVYSPDGKLVVLERSGLIVIRVRDGRLMSTLVQDVDGRLSGESFDGSHPDWQPRR